jgi:hypothetical protein
MKITRSHSTGLLLIALSVGSVALGQDVVIKEAPVEKRSQNSVIFSTRAAGSAGVAGMEEMAARLKDPAKRAQLRAEHREQIQSQHADIAEVISLEPQMESDLIDLLTEQQLAHLDVFYSRMDASREAHDELLRNHAATQSRNKQQIRELLGEERFGRYLDYTDTMVERRQANYFNAHLGPGDKLTADQKTRLMAMLRDHQEKSNERRMRTSKLMLPGFLPARAEDREELLRKHTIAMNEEGFRELQEESRLLLAHLPEVLTSSQLDVYAQLEAEKIAAQRKYVQQMRVSAGMAPEFDETPRPPAAERVRVAGQVKLQVSVSGDQGEPLRADFILENGTPSEPFKGPGELWVQATPILYEDGLSQVEFAFSEEIHGRRRPVQGKMVMGSQSGQTDVPLGTGRSSTSVSGSKVYAISVDARVSRVR